MSKKQLPSLSERCGASGMSKGQKWAGFNKVPDFLRMLMQPHKPMQRIAPSKIQHAHSRKFRPRPARCSADSRPIPDSFPGAANALWGAPTIATGGVSMIYVDPIQHYPQCRLPYKHWCHMATDGPLSELHQMAEQLGLRRAWFQNKPTHPLYDLTPGKRAASHPVRRVGGQHARTATARLSTNHGQEIATTDKIGSAMMLAHEFVHAPRLNRPQKPVGPPRRLRRRWRRFPSVSRLTPPVSRLLPRCFSTRSATTVCRTSASLQICGHPCRSL